MGQLSTLQTLHGHLPPKHASNWRQILAKHVSDDSRRFTFRHQKKDLYLLRLLTTKTVQKASMKLYDHMII